MTNIRVRALIGAALLCALGASPVTAQTCPTPAEAAQPAKPKKKGLGLGGLLKAAKNAGVGDLLGGGLLGDSTMAQVAGAVAGTAVNASDGGANGMTGMTGALGSLAGTGRAGQIAGVATSALAGLAAGAASAAPANPPAAAPCTPAPAAATAPATTSWN